MGSVKDLEVIKDPTRTKMGLGRFHFSDRYSVFDWGEMPDHIENKGAALCLMGAYCFERLEEIGVKTHYRGLVAKNGKTIGMTEIEEPSNVMEINLANVIRPKVFQEKQKLRYSYSAFTADLANFLIPLEVIYRNRLPEGSSIFNRLEKGLVNIKDLGLDHYPSPGERLLKPILDVSTKLEDKDRYVTWPEAQKMAGLSAEELDDTTTLLSEVNQTITQIALTANLENEDGKMELAFDPARRLMLVDVVGTLDESRFTYKGLHVSKEIARQFYKRTKWYDDLEEAKKKAEARGTAEWRGICRSRPPKLDPKLKDIIREMYTAVVNEMTSRRFFDTPRLAEVIKKYREYVSDK